MTKCHILLPLIGALQEEGSLLGDYSFMSSIVHFSRGGEGASTRRSDSRRDKVRGKWCFPLKWLSGPEFSLLQNVFDVSLHLFHFFFNERMMHVDELLLAVTV